MMNRLFPPRMPNINNPNPLDIKVVLPSQRATVNLRSKVNLNIVALCSRRTRPLRSVRFNRGTRVRISTVSPRRRPLCLSGKSARSFTSFFHPGAHGPGGISRSQRVSATIRRRYVHSGLVILFLTHICLCQSF
jgi:hypothetical protein